MQVVAQRRGPTPKNGRCRCGVQYLRHRSSVLVPADQRAAVAMRDAVAHVGWSAPFVGVAVYQALTENA